MRLRTLRARIVVAAALSITITILGLGLGVEVLVGRHLRSALDATLRDRAAEVAHLSATAPELLTTPGTLDSPLGGRALSVEVLDGQGRVVGRSLALGNLLLPATGLAQQAIRQGRSGYGDGHLDDDRVRMYAAPLASRSGQTADGAVIVASSTDELDETLRQLRYILGLSALVAAVSAALAAALLLRQALRPLALLSTAAADIEQSGDASRRLPSPETSDEVGRLAETLNDMLGSLERAQERERRFVADASHELRTPLTALRGNAAFVARQGAVPGDEVVADLEADAARMAALIESLLALSREDAAGPPKEIVRLDELAREQGANDRSLDVRAAAPVRVRGDRQALERALANLVQNARRHGPSGGPIRITAEETNGEALLSVSDDGPGPPTSQAAFVFERFSRGDHSGHGSGLGLAIVRATAERHGGSVSVDGSRFTLALPVFRELSEPGARTGSRDRETGTS